LRAKIATIRRNVRQFQTQQKSTVEGGEGGAAAASDLAADAPAGEERDTI